MDQPGLDENLHVQALRGLERINFVSRSAGILWSALKPLLRELDRPVRLLDVATGAGDVPIALWRRARRGGYALDISACDCSTTALAHAEQNAAAGQAPIRFFRHDILSEVLVERYDVVTCSLFLHHLEEAQAVELLRMLGQATGRLLLINDLKRSSWGLMLAHVATRVLSASPVVHVDGPLSVRAAFTRQEALDLARRAGLEGAQIRSRWPSRWLLCWQRYAAHESI